MKSKISTAYVDLDGCFNAGPEYGGSTFFAKSAPYKWELEIPNIRDFLRFRDFYRLDCHVVTGRSIKISEDLLRFFANAPSVIEHGTIIYDPTNGARERHITEFDQEQYGNLREAKDNLESFIVKTAPNLMSKLQQLLPECKLAMLYDNLHIWSVEIFPPALESVKKLQKIIGQLLPGSIIRNIQGGFLREMISRGAYEILPAVSKKVALESLIDIKKIDVSSSLGIGDSIHSDDWLKTILERGGCIGCPANADEELKEIVTAARDRGFVSSKGYFLGSREILEHFIGPFPL
ncbi:MAG: hypothetical protein Q7R46_00265 [bacterium]|nr:hypothetical protein [bacterium]